MSLNFDLSEIPEETRTVIADYDSPTRGIHKGDRILSPVTDALIWSTMLVGIGVLDDSTIPEFAARLDLYQRLNGPLLHDEGTEPWPITLEDVQAHKGLSTNVFPMETRVSWVKRIVRDSDTFQGVTEPKRRR